jgi:prepilin-type N-terminal cleavage/methylation domain-containing protein
MPASKRQQSAARQAGFTLVEALVAVVILVVGLMAVTNLMIVAGSSNAVANQGTAATECASEVLERLKRIRFVDLAGQTCAAANCLTADQGSQAGCNGNTTDCVIPGNFNEQLVVPGGATIKTRWQIIQPDVWTLYIRVRAETTNPLLASRTRAEFTTIRTCTAVDVGCP